MAENEFPNLPFVGRFRSNNDIEDVAADIWQVLGLTGEWASAMPTWEKALNHLAEKVEEQAKPDAKMLLATKIADAVLLISA